MLLASEILLNETVIINEKDKLRLKNAF
jgi:hypothetical protein